MHDASPPHTDGSIVFVRWRHSAAHLVHPNWHQNHTGAAPCWVSLWISTARHVPGRPLFPSKLPLHMWGSGPLSNTRFLGPTRVHKQTASRSVQPFQQGSRSWQTDRVADHATPSVVLGCIYIVLWCGLITWPYTRNQWQFGPKGALVTLMKWFHVKPG